MATDTPAVAPQPLLETECLSRSFGGVHALRDVTLSLARGELHAIIGPNGAGKSTLVNLLSGALRPTGGHIRLDGRDVTTLAQNKRVHLGLARSFQRTNILPGLSVLENVRLAAQAMYRATGWATLASPNSATELIEHAATALARVGLPSGHERDAGTLAHGQKRQLEIAMALASRPKVLLLDEPLAGMGPEEGERMADLLRSLATEHALLLIEHDMDFVFAVANRLTVLVEGAVLASGHPDHVRADPAVQQAYLGGQS
ncbi:MAG: ABC transporter ATP-binding protein [Hyphomicrobiaceae bacterium]